MRDTSALSTTKCSLSRRNVACETWETTCTSNRPKTGACSYKATVRNPALRHMLRAGAGRSIASSCLGRHPVMCPLEYRVRYVHLFRGPCHMTNTGLFIGQEQGGNYNTRRRLAQESLELRQQWSSMPFSSEQRGGFGNHLCRQHLCNELQLNRPPSSTTLTWNTLYLVFFMCWA